MSAEPTYYIDKNRKLSPSEDFRFLQKEGLRYIEKLGHKFWTDYNPHDPGITMLEVLCYAITELGYRADFDIRDLLTGKNGKIRNKSFFTAASIFSNAPLTVIDYRKMLIDIEGVSNAWYLPTTKNEDADGYLTPNDSEAAIYLNVLDDKLSLAERDRRNTLLEKLSLRGLSHVKIELDEDAVLGDLNTLILDYAFWNADHWIDLRIVPQFTDWNDPDAGLFAKMTHPDNISIDSITETHGILLLIVQRQADPSESLHFRIFNRDMSEVAIAKQYLSDPAHVCDVISLFDRKKRKIAGIFSAIKVKLQQNRNLTEDFLCPGIVEKILIGICADIELEPDADPVEMMARIRMAIDGVINPRIRFYTLSQLVAEGMHSEDIFMGPRLKHGFLKDDEIVNSGLPTAIHASDIIAEIMAVEGVKSVRNFLMLAYNALGMPIAGKVNQPWTLELPGDVKPVFDPGISKLLLFLKNIPFLLSETQAMLADQKTVMYQTQAASQKLQNAESDFTIVAGTHYALDTYYSIQNDFPAKYGLGKNYLAKSESRARKGQVKQLKGYLLFYEQILADFFSQLYHAKDIFDTRPKSRTYFPAFLEKDALTGDDFYSSELYDADFRSALLNGDPRSDASLYETKEKFHKRRNRVLDHLLARFSETFSDYVFMMYRVADDDTGMGELAFDHDDLIADKQRFINNYAEVSHDRGLGLDYFNATMPEGVLTFDDFWGTPHRGGYEKRVAGLLGMNEIPLRDIVSRELPRASRTISVGDEEYVLNIITPGIDLGTKWDWLQLHILDRNAYKIDRQSGKYYLYLVDGNNKIVRLEKAFSTQKSAYVYLQRMMKALNNHFENFYCLEHILLRPFDNRNFNDGDLLPVCLNDNCGDPAGHDPYSFKATLVLPGYLSRFRSIVFREYAEKIFRQEAPAHVLLKICWVGPDDMLAFQDKYRIWLEGYRIYRSHFCENTLTHDQKIAYEATLSDLVAALRELNTIYPEGNLYDCRMSKSNNPIILGNTSLGTL